MDTGIVLVIVLLVVIGAVAWILMQRRRSEELRERFGPEYQRAVDELGDPQRAESELAAREKRVEKFDIRPLTAQEHQRFTQAWRSAQSHFVDEPTATIKQAERLVTDLMRTRGYPIADFDQRAADISVDHPNVVENYRAARAIAIANEREAASTEQLRQAMVHYRALFEDLLETNTPLEKEVGR
ncbi:MAG: hypothetical protein ACJ8CR_23845 [Roseiflexaceae bacterium]|jgi:hypothetical protein